MDNLGAGFNMCHKDCSQTIFNDSNGFQDNNQSLYKSRNNGLMYGSVGEEFFEQI